MELPKLFYSILHKIGKISLVHMKKYVCECAWGGEQNGSKVPSGSPLPLPVESELPMRHPNRGVHSSRV